MPVAPYCTVDQLREHLEDTGNVVSATRLQRLIDTASRQIEQYCGRRFWPDTTATVRLYRPEDPYLAWVDDISTTAGLIVETDPVDDGTFPYRWELNTDFRLEPENADSGGAGSAYCWWRIRSTGRTHLFPTGGRRPSLQVTARWGWSTIPPPIEEACILRAANLFSRRKSPHGIAAFEGWGSRISRQDPDVAALLYPYVKVRLGAV